MRQVLLSFIPDCPVFLPVHLILYFDAYKRLANRTRMFNPCDRRLEGRGSERFGGGLANLIRLLELCYILFKAIEGALYRFSGISRVQRVIKARPELARWDRGCLVSWRWSVHPGRLCRAIASYTKSSSLSRSTFRPHCSLEPANETEVIGGRQ